MGRVLVEMESLQLVMVFVVYRFNWFRYRIVENKISSRPCALRSPLLVSSSTHLDASGVPIVAGYVAIPPRALFDPDSR